MKTTSMRLVLAAGAFVAAGAFALTAGALTSAGAIAQAQCINKAGKGTGGTDDDAKFQAWEAVLQGTDWGSWGNWMVSSQKVGVAPGYKVMVGAQNFETSSQILAPAGVALAVHAVESNLVTPLFVGRRLSMHPLALLLAVMLGAGLWGLPGAMLALVIWVGSSFVLRWVLTHSVGDASTSIYGPLAAPIIVLIWLYFLAIAVLIGAGLNAASRQLWPPEGTSFSERLRLAPARRGTLTPVPEPASVASFALGLAALWAWRRRSTHRPSAPRTAC